jgi:Predicted periplasmic solute-binding protein
LWGAVRILTYVKVELHNGLGYGMDNLGFESLQRKGMYAFSEGSRLDLGLSQLGALSLGVKRSGRTLYTHLHLLPTLRMSGATLSVLLHAFNACTETVLPLRDGLRNGTFTSSRRVSVQCRILCTSLWLSSMLCDRLDRRLPNCAPRGRGILQNIVFFFFSICVHYSFKRLLSC